MNTTLNTSFCVSLPDDNNCNTGWYGWKGHCYLFAFNLGRESFFDASKECVKQDALFMTVNSEAERQLISSLHNNMPYLSPPAAYSIGLHAPFFNDIYVSADGTLILVSFWSVNVW